MARKMKDSGVEWIGKIPEGWKVIRLKYLADFEPSCDTSHLTADSEITYSPMECIKNGTFENRPALYGSISHTLTPFQNGDIVMAKVTPCFENGNIAIMNNLFSGFGLGSSELFVFRSRDILPHYLFYWLQNKAFVAKACSTMTGTGGLKRISPSFIRNCPIHCPPFDEQQQISNYLDSECSRIDAMLTKTRASIEEYKKLKQAVITQAVTKGVRGEREMKDSGVEWIGEIPREWNKCHLKNISSEIGDGLHGTPNFDDNGDIFFINGNNIGGKYVEPKADTKRINSREFLKYVSPNFSSQTIMISLNGSYGKVSLYKSFPMLLGKSAGYITLLPSVDCRYIKYYLSSTPSQIMMTLSLNGTTIPNLSLNTLRNFSILLPVLCEQKEIADYLDAKCAEIDQLIAKKEQLVKELEGYKKSLIYEVVTGKREV